MRSAASDVYKRQYQRRVRGLSFFRICRTSQVYLCKNTMERAMEMSLDEIIALQTLYTSMSEKCWNKCVQRFTDSELTVGEGACLDRCVSKFFAVFQKINTTNMPAPNPGMQ
eukprot:TRINITY_DN5786_c0_g1_i1.p1 TRINITY_DN5786_c0_g1~~TRINITY_DN5786_c0_g1_i1.p1  ORF type:complete len:112 (+),score=10.55 TRINITY_DN5786_c0_g1_i1:2-337(+)